MSDWTPILEFTTAEAITEGKAVYYATTTITMADAVTEEVLGIAVEDAASGAKCSVQVGGIALATANGSGTAIIPGDRLSAGTTDGVLIKHDEQTGTVCAGIALDGTTAAAGRIRMLISTSKETK
jgi:hypothetical protein